MLIIFTGFKASADKAIEVLNSCPYPIEPSIVIMKTRFYFERYITNVEPFKIVDKLGRKIELKKETIWHILRRPEMENEEESIKNCLTDPDEIVESPKSKSVTIFK